MLRPDGLERAQATRRLDVADDANHHHRWSLDDRYRFNNLLLVNLFNPTRECIMGKDKRDTHRLLLNPN